MVRPQYHDTKLNKNPLSIKESITKPSTQMFLKIKDSNRPRPKIVGQTLRPARTCQINAGCPVPVPDTLARGTDVFVHMPPIANNALHTEPTHSQTRTEPT